jgi:hypothetical protein
MRDKAAEPHCWRPRDTVPLEKPTVRQLGKKFPSFYKISSLAETLQLFMVPALRSEWAISLPILVYLTPMYQFANAGLHERLGCLCTVQSGRGLLTELTSRYIGSQCWETRGFNLHPGNGCPDEGISQFVSIATTAFFQTHSDSRFMVVFPYIFTLYSKFTQYCNTARSRLSGLVGKYISPKNLNPR